MVKYDSQGVPILGFHNPAGITLYPEGLYSYSMGNTRAKDITELLGTSKEQHLDLLLLASGDVRNILYTVSEISLRKLQERPESLSVHLNDYDPSIVARNAILLEVAGSINPDVSGDMDFLWNIWYNMTLSESDFVRLRQVLSSLIENNFDGSDQGVLKFKEGAVLQECCDIWKDWMRLDLNVKSVKEDRKKLIEKRSQELGLNVDGQCDIVVSQMMMGISDEADYILRDTSTREPFYTEIKHWFIEGSTSDESDEINPTLIAPFIHKWKQHYGACAFESYLPVENQDLLRCRSLTAACKESLKLLVKRFQQYQKSHSTALKVTLWTGDALSLCTSGFPPELTFDVIDTSNVSDHIGLLNVLVCCAPRLKKPNESLLFTSSMVWSKGCQSIEEFYDKSVGVPVQLLPTILGLKLAVDLDLGSSKLPENFHYNGEETLCWVKAEPKRTTLTIEKNSDVAQALLRLVERCFNLLKERECQACGVTSSSPLTLLRIIHQIEPFFIGGATAIFNILESELPSDFNKKFGFSWNLLKASIGGEREPIVEIKAATKISIASRYTGTPMPILCITVDHDTLEVDQFRWQFGLPIPVRMEPTFSVIYNSLRYDDTTHVVTFHLCEKDWDELKSKAWMWIASSDLIPVIKREPIFLGGEAVETTGRVDPVEKFGLFSVQTFTEAESNNNCEILKVLKVEENKFSYCAELEILDSVRCKAKAMKIRFQPVACSTKVTIYFEGAEGEQCIMYFSCAVDEGASKFQISRKQGKILCHIAKKEEGTVGELVIKCPAPLPFHAMPLWEYKLVGTITKVFGLTLRSKRDLEWNARRMGGSPFYDLRETISRIFTGHIRETKIPKMYCIDERGPIEELYGQTPDVMARKRGFVIKIKEMYKWKNLPVAKVLFYDCQRFANQLRSDATAAARVMSSFFSVTWQNHVERIVADQQEKSLLRKLLYTNAARVIQDNGSYVWKDSFLSPLFPRESVELEPINEYTETRSTEQEITRDGPSDFLSGLLQGEMGSFRTGLDRTSTCGPPQWAPPLREPECALCHSKTGDLKRCLGCKKVFYCGRQCQKQHWKKHKPECQNRDSK